jgi:phospholipid transport system substrate-binding protein
MNILTSNALPSRRAGNWLVGMMLSALMLLAMTSGRAWASVTPPQVMLKNLTDEVITVLKRDQARVHKEPTYLFDLVEQVLLPHVDMDVMSRYVLGRYWRTATKEQRSRFRHEFKNLLVRFYVSALIDDPAKIDEMLANTEHLINYLPVTVDDTTRKTTVRAEVNMPNGGPKVPVSFSLFRNKEGEWMMYDVNVDGISLVTNYRNSFASEIKRDGLDTLIDRLAERNRELLEKAKAKNGKPAQKNGE